MNDLACLAEAIRDGRRDQATALTQQAIGAEVEPRQILDTMVGAMDEVGGRFQRNEIFVPEMLIASRAMKEALALLEPILVEAGIRPEHTAVIGTVQGDLHDIGKNLVAMMWKGANFAVHDLGTNVAPEAFVDAARAHEADIVGLSALLTTTMPGMKDTIAALRGAGLDGIKVVIGGAPVTAEFAEHIAADAYAPDAATAVEAARSVVAAA